jgi:hypothetical protein
MSDENPRKRFSFNFSKILDVVKAASANPNLQNAGSLLFDRLADRIAAAAHDPTLIKAIATEVKQGGPALVGAIVKGTEAEHLVDPEIVHKVEGAVGSDEKKG